MGLLINRAFIQNPVEPEWIREEIFTTFTSASPMGAINTSVIWTPPEGEVHLVRGVVGWADDADPLADNGGSGATSVRIGGNGGLNSAQFVNSSVFAAWNNFTNIQGWGPNSPATLGNTPTGVVLVGPNLKGKPGSMRSLTCGTDTGTAVGTLIVAFEHKRVN